MSASPAGYIQWILALAIVSLCGSSMAVPAYSYAVPYSAPVAGAFVGGLYPNEAVFCGFSSVQSTVNPRPFSQLSKETGYQSVPVNLLRIVDQYGKCYSSNMIITPRYNWIQLEIAPAYSGEVTFHSSHRLRQMTSYDVGNVDAGSLYSVWFQANDNGLIEVWYSLNGQDSTHVWLEV